MVDAWIEITDEEGNSLQTKKYDGKYYAVHFIGNVKDHLNDIDAMDIRDDDTFILSYPKSVVYGSWFDNVKTWEKARNKNSGNNVLYLIYEDMIQDLRSHVEKIASFLETDTTTDFLDLVTEKCTFKNMAIEATEYFQAHDQWKRFTSNKTLPIYRKGQIGDWKNHFTVAQNEWFDKVYSENMQGSSFNFRFE